MKVTIIDYQKNALDLLIFSKSTRLMGKSTLEDIEKWEHSKKLEELDYIKNTIKSSWEFVRYIFMIEDVSRSFTHQLVRTRNASYAQESLRAVNKKDASYYLPEFDDKEHEKSYLAAIEHSRWEYENLIECGAKIQDAREILPTSINTSILMGISLRELSHMAETRLCTRSSGEYQRVFREIKNKINEVHPYFDDMIEVYCVQYGTCCFPNYTECPIQKNVLYFDDEHREMIKSSWGKTNHVSNPIAKKGKTQ